MHASTGSGRAPSAADRVYAYVKDGVVARRFDPADLLAEGQIADDCGVSRTPVREGLLRLEAEGLVRLLPKRGVLVVPVTPAEISDVLETRLLVESFAIGKAVRTGPSKLLGTILGRQLEAMAQAVDASDTQAYVAADRAFHAAIVDATGNEILINLYSSLRDRQLRMGVVNLLDETDGRVDPVRMRSSLAEHQGIADALREGDAVRAEQATVEHLEGTRLLLWGQG